MTRSLLAAFGTIVIIGLAAFSTHQNNTLEDRDKTIVHQIGEIEYLENNLEEETNLRMASEALNFSYENKIEQLRDSVAQLETTARRLRRTIRKQDKSLKTLSSKLKKIEQSYEKIKLEISELARQDQLDQQRINQLEAEKAEMRNSITTIERTKEKIDQEKQKIEQDLMATQMEEARLARIGNILDNTRVVYQSVSLQKKRFGKKITKIGKRNSKWAYTLLNFQLIHDNHQLLLDENFIAKIVNTDTNEILSYVESNPNFPDSDKDSKGVPFKFDGNSIEIAHFNNQKKNGSNFEVQIFYIDNTGQEHLLRGGVRDIIKGRKLVK